MFYLPFCFDYFQIAFLFWFLSTLTCQSCLLLPPTRPEPREGHFHLPPVSPLERPPGPVATCHQAMGNCTQIDIKNFATSQFNCSLVSHVLVGGNPPLFYSEMFLWGPLQSYITIHARQSYFTPIYVIETTNMISDCFTMIIGWKENLFILPPSSY